jgi:hypothetical protein
MAHNGQSVWIVMRSEYWIEGDPTKEVVHGVFATKAAALAEITKVQTEIDSRISEVWLDDEYPVRD